MYGESKDYLRLCTGCKDSYGKLDSIIISPTRLRKPSNTLSILLEKPRITPGITIPLTIPGCIHRREGLDLWPATLSPTLFLATPSCPSPATCWSGGFVAAALAVASHYGIGYSARCRRSARPKMAPHGAAPAQPGAEYPS